MGIFTKSACSICGEKSGLISGRRLADGDLCKSCRSRLSPFYTVMNTDTVRSIQAQLEWREKNRTELASFRPDVTAGREGKVFIDTGSGRFALCRDRDLRSGNPDLFDLRSLLDCTLEVEENEISGDEDENGYSYDFQLMLRLDHPFVRRISFRINDKRVIDSGRPIREEDIRKIYEGSMEMKRGLSAFVNGVDKKAVTRYLEQ